MGLLKTAAKVAVASSVHGRVQRRQQQRWAAQDAGAAAPESATGSQLHAAATGAAVASPAEDPMVAQLRQLAGLRDSGVLTEEEFAAKKAKILGI
jgi:hypothetical protein